MERTSGEGCGSAPLFGLYNGILNQKNMPFLRGLPIEKERKMIEMKG